ncbi:hypothetical protein ACFWE4_32940, partial [Streptomyces sp. NPDC060187]
MMSTPRTTATPARTTEPVTAEHTAAPGSRGGRSSRPATQPDTTTSATAPPGGPTPATATTGRFASRTRT